MLNSPPLQANEFEGQPLYPCASHEPLKDHELKPAQKELMFLIFLASLCFSAQYRHPSQQDPQGFALEPTWGLSQVLTPLLDRGRCKEFPMPSHTDLEAN